MGHHHHGDGHDHNHYHGRDATAHRLVISLFLNLAITAAEIIGGILSGSLSLLSDSLHNLSDSASMVVSLFARKVSQRPSSYEKTFGYKRAEILAALLNTAALLGISFYLFREAYDRFLHPEPINGMLMFVVAIIGLLGNLISALLLFRSAKESLNIRSTYLHILSDALSSVGVIVGGLLVITLNWTIVDPILTVIIAGYVLYGSWGVLRETVHILMQGAPSHIDIDNVVQELTRLPGVEEIHHVHIWSLSETDIHFECHVRVQSEDITEWERIKKDIKELLHEKYEIEHTTLEVECEACTNRGMVCPRGCDEV